jgi:hypothetical protein
MQPYSIMRNLSRFLFIPGLFFSIAYNNAFRSGEGTFLNLSANFYLAMAGLTLLTAYILSFIVYKKTKDIHALIPDNSYGVLILSSIVVLSFSALLFYLAIQRNSVLLGLITSLFLCGSILSEIIVLNHKKAERS